MGFDFGPLWKVKITRKLECANWYSAVVGSTATVTTVVEHIVIQTVDMTTCNRRLTGAVTVSSRSTRVINAAQKTDHVLCLTFATAVVENCRLTFMG